MGIGKSTARRYDQDKDTKVTFDDVAGIDEAENELVEIVDFLRDTKKYTRLGGTAPKGVLLVGAPGTGKTLLARAVAGEAGVPFFSMSAAEFVEMIVGVGAARVRDLFKQAREHAPAIVFIDELDAIGRASPAGSFESVFGREGRAVVYLYCGATTEPGHHFHARMFAPGLGIREDPATGAAAAAFAGVVMEIAHPADGEHRFVIEQGYEMGRPSQIELGMTMEDGVLTRATIGGSAIIVSDGTIEA